MVEKDLSYIENFNQNIDFFEKIKFLPTEVQTIIILHYFEDLTLADVAYITDTNINTVKTRLYNALKKLKVELEGEKI